MNYTGIDLHKQTSYLTTINENGVIVKQKDIKNNNHNLYQYFSDLGSDNIAAVEATTSWYWLDDLFSELNFPLIFAHAKYLKAIAYGKVKTDKVDSSIIAQLLRLDFIPKAHKIPNEFRDLRDTLRARIKLNSKLTSAKNSIHRIFEKYNTQDSDKLPPLTQNQLLLLNLRVSLLKEHILNLEKSLYPFLIPNPDIQRLLWIPGIGKMNAFTIYLEVFDINRFPDVKNFFSYCRLSPAAKNSAGKTKQVSSKDGNPFLKSVFTDAAVHAVQYYPVIKKYFNSKLRKKNKQVARIIIAKEIARIVYSVLKNKTEFNHKFKGLELKHKKTLQWPRVLSPCA